MDLEYNEVGAAGKQWENFMGAALFAYNYGSTHRALFDLFNRNSPILKTITGIAHRKGGDRPYTYTKRAYIYPRRPKQYKNEADRLAGRSNPNYSIIPDISPGSIDAQKEAIIVAVKRKQNQDLRDYYDRRYPTRFPGVAVTRKLNKAGYEGHLDDLFGKRRNEKSQLVYVTTRSETTGKPTNTFEVVNYDTGVPLKRHYLPWELDKQKTTWGSVEV